MRRASGLRSLEKLLWLGGVLGIAPSPPHPTKIQVFYVIFILLLSISAYIHSLFGKITDVSVSANGYMMISDQMSCFCLFLTISIAQMMILMYPKKMHGILISLSNFDRKVDMGTKNSFWVFLLFIHILIFGVISLDIWMWLPALGMDIYQYYFIKNIHYYQVTILMFLWFWLATEIRGRFKLLNNMLRKALRVPHNLKIFRLYDERDTGRILGKFDVGKELKVIAKLHNSLCDVVDDVNSFFGITFLFFVMFAISLAVDSMILIVLGASIEDDLQNIFSVSQLRFVSGMWMTDNLMMILMYPKKMHGILISLSNFDRKADITCLRIKKTFWVFLSFIHISTLGVLSLDMWMWFPVIGMDKYKYYFIKNIHYYQVNILMFLWFWLAIEICSRFKLLNNMLRNALTLPYNLKIFRLYDERDIGRFLRKFDVEKELKLICKLHNSLCDVVDDVNSFFRITLLFFVLFAIALALNYVMLIVLAAILEGELQIDFSILQLRLVSSMWMTDNLVSIGEVLIKVSLIIFLGLKNVYKGTIFNHSAKNIREKYF
ncbi:hypothetical protein JTB14_036852 [Gonioctena quinquepunctata]|nr:hypothetical protein JTB14_036852 [Gonioctena quinquepunctata]